MPPSLTNAPAGLKSALRRSVARATTTLNTHQDRHVFVFVFGPNARIKVVEAIHEPRSGGRKSAHSQKKSEPIRVGYGERRFWDEL